MLKSILALALFLAGTRAQDSDCVSLDGETFQFCTGTLGIDIFWNWNATHTELLYEAEDDGWKAVGFSTGGRMVGSNAVLGCFDDLDDSPAGADYNLGAKQPSGVTPQGLQELALYEQDRADGLCTVRFLRPNSPDGVPEEQFLTNRDQNVVLAQGGDNLGAHNSRNRASFIVNFVTGENNDAAGLSAPKALLGMMVASVVALLW